MPKLLELVRNPIAYIAARWTPSPRTVERAALAALLMSILLPTLGKVREQVQSGLSKLTERRPASGSNGSDSSAADGPTTDV